MEPPVVVSKIVCKILPQNRSQDQITEIAAEWRGLSRLLATGGVYAGLVFHRHGVRVDGLFSRHAFQPSQNPSVIIFIALNCEAALLVTIGPGQSDEMFLGL